MFSITLQRDVLKAVSRFMAKEDVRYYLNGVKVEMYREVAYLVATDEHRMAVARITRPEGETWETGEAIIPGEAIASVLRSGAAGVKRLPVVLTVEGDAFTFNACGAITGGKLVEGRFPDWRKVIPLTVSGEVANFNFEYLADMHKAAADLGSRYSPAIGYNGLSSAILELRHDVLAVLMPMHNDAPEGSPEWVREDSENLGRVLDVEEAHGEAIAEDRVRSLPAGESAELETANDSEPVAISA